MISIIIEYCSLLALIESPCLVISSLPFKGAKSESEPFLEAWSARVCDLMANSSCSKRETLNAAANLSPEWPITSLVENSAIPGNYKEIEIMVKPVKC